MQFIESESFKDALKRLPQYVDGCFERLRQDQVEWQSNVVLVIGERGAGKSTVLKRVLDHMIEKNKVTQAGAVPCPPKYIVFDPLDCSQLPGEIPLGLAVLMHIKNHDQLGPVREELESLTQRLCRFHDKYSDLCMNISNSAEEFGSYLSSSIEERLKTKKDLADILCRAQDKKCFSVGLVIPLDDFDLIQKADVKKWFRSMLDEMHQLKIVFMVTADFYRLQHQSYGGEPGDDFKTGHAIVNKLFPPASRFWLQPWSLEEADAFPAKGDRSLLELLRRLGEAYGLSFPLIYQFIPHLPRGWHGLYARFLEWESEGRKPSLDVFLGLIANCREEVLLARKLSEQALDVWVDDIPFFDEPIDRPAWEELVETAIKRAKSELAVLPVLPCFLKPETIKFEQTSFSHDPHWGAPLRRDQYFQFALRDAAKEASFWAELLVDLGLGDKEQGTNGTFKASAYRNRLKLVNRWQVLAARFDKAKFEIRCDLPFLLDYFSVSTNPAYHGALFWFERVPEESHEPGFMTLAFGWPVLMRRLASDDPFHVELRELLLVSTEDLSGEALDLTEGQLYDFLPDQVWSFVLLADGLTRCPWSVLSAYRNWQLPVYLGLTVALVRSAFVFALVQLGSNFKCSPAQRLMISVLRTQSIMAMKVNDELELIQFLDELFGDGLAEALASHPQSKTGLFRALAAFLASPLYLQVVEHFQRHARNAKRLAKARSLGAR